MNTNPLFFILLFLFSAYQANAQNREGQKLPARNIKIADGYIVELFGYDVTHFEIDLNNVEIDTSEIQIHHLLCVAATHCDYEMIRSLLSFGVNPNAICDVDHVMTEVAFCEEKALPITKLFLQHGANINVADQDNDSYLSYAISRDNVPLVAYLLENGADLMQRDTNRNLGCLPMHSIESVEMLELLMKYDINILDRCDNGRTLLHFAAKDNLTELARYLLKNNMIDKNIKDKNGETAYDYAVRFRNEEVKKLLE